MVEGQRLAELIARLIGCIEKRHLEMYNGRVDTTRLTRSQFDSKFRSLDRAMGGKLILALQRAPGLGWIDTGGHDFEVSWTCRVEEGDLACSLSLVQDGELLIRRISGRLTRRWRKALRPGPSASTPPDVLKSYVAEIEKGDFKAAAAMLGVRRSDREIASEVRDFNKGRWPDWANSLTRLPQGMATDDSLIRLRIRMLRNEGTRMEVEWGKFEMGWRLLRVHVRSTVSRRIYKLIRYGSLDELFRALRSRDVEVRRAAAEQLSFRGPQPYGNSDWRRIVDEHRNDVRVLGSLIRSLADPEPAVRIFVAKMVRELMPADTPYEIFREVGKDDRLAKILVAAMHDPLFDVRRTAAVAVGGLRRRDGLEPLLRMLRSADSRLRWDAAAGLRALGDPRAVDALRASDAGSIVISALGAIQDPRAAEALIEIVADRSSPHRGGAAFYLGNMKDPRALDSLIDAVRDGVEVAAVAVGKLRDPKALEPIIEVLKRPDPDGRKHLYAAEGLGLLGDERAMETLVELLESGENEEARRQAARSLRAIGTGRCVRFLESRLKKHDFVGECAALALGAEHSPLAKEIIDLIPDDSHD